MSTSTSPAPAVPRHSASLILLNPDNQVLLIHRPRHSTTFANAHVFPGGVVSPSDSSPAPPTPIPTAETLAITALRETFEETGLLLTTAPPPKHVSIAEARKKMHNGELGFAEFLSTFGGKPDVRTLRTFTKWVTPRNMARRFSSQLYIGYTPVSSLSASGDGGIEVVSTTFLHPRTALNAAKRGEIVFFPPQFYLLSRMAEIFTSGPGGDLREKEDERIRLWKFASGGFGDMVIEPEAVKKLGGGRVVMGLNGGEGKGDAERVVVVGIPQGGGEPRGLELRGKGEVAKL
ncbi:hypothetical protein RUND412_005806 [Rhizina undulata]